MPASGSGGLGGLPSCEQPAPLAAGLGPGVCALCLFSLFRHGRSSLATELHQLRSKENGVPACEITLSPADRKSVV